MSRKNHLLLVTENNNKNPEEAKAFVEAAAAKLPSSDLQKLVSLLQHF